jgi:transcriptional antiterminator RfaH
MAFWAVARCLARRETYAADHLVRGGFEVFVPKINTGVLFPTYVFVKVNGGWRAIERTVGVAALVRFGETPGRLPDSEIAALRERVDSMGQIALAPRPRLTPGDQVSVGLINGVFVGQSARERQKVLIRFLGRALEVELKPGSHLVSRENPH